MILLALKFTLEPTLVSKAFMILTATLFLDLATSIALSCSYF